MCVCVHVHMCVGRRISFNSHFSPGGKKPGRLDETWGSTKNASCHRHLVDKRRKSSFGDGPDEIPAMGTLNASQRKAPFTLKNHCSSQLVSLV